jgi:hypothetical protein
MERQNEGTPSRFFSLRYAFTSRHIRKRPTMFLKKKPLKRKSFITALLPLVSIRHTAGLVLLGLLK